MKKVYIKRLLVKRGFLYCTQSQGQGHDGGRVIPRELESLVFDKIDEG